MRVLCAAVARCLGVELWRASVHPCRDTTPPSVDACIVCTDVTNARLRCCDVTLCVACEAKWASECAADLCVRPKCPACRAVWTVRRSHVDARVEFIKALVCDFDRVVDPCRYPLLHAAAGAALMVHSARALLALMDGGDKATEGMKEGGKEGGKEGNMDNELSMWQSVLQPPQAAAARRLMTHSRTFTAIEGLLTGNDVIDGLIALTVAGVRLFHHQDGTTRRSSGQA